MTRKLRAGDRLVIASHNQGKTKEIAVLLAPFGIKAISAAALSLPEPEETGDSFKANAELKAKAAAAISGLPALADDSGLSVDALSGAPGVYSARWAGSPANFKAAMARIEQEMGHSPNRNAHFTCALCIAWPDGEIATVEGVIEGGLSFPPKGEKGFGYDPIFVPEGETRSFGEMAPEEKDAISHRARAFALLTGQCFGD